MAICAMSFNTGLPSDRFQVDWWINTKRVERRLSKRPRTPLSLNHLTRVGVHPLYSPQTGADNLPRPPEHVPALEAQLIAAEIPPILWRSNLRTLPSPTTGDSLRANSSKRRLQKATSSPILFSIKVKIRRIVSTS